jgi:hypothetical protein
LWREASLKSWIIVVLKLVRVTKKGGWRLREKNSEGKVGPKRSK